MTDESFAVLIEETNDRATADTPEAIVYAGAALLEGARKSGCEVPHAFFFFEGVLVRGYVTRTEIAAVLGKAICWCGRGGLYRKDGLPFCCAKHEVLWDEWSDELRAKTIVAQFIARHGGKRTHQPDPKPSQKTPKKNGDTDKRKGKGGKGKTRRN